MLVSVYNACIYLVCMFVLCTFGDLVLLVCFALFGLLFATEFGGFAHLVDCFVRGFVVYTGLAVIYFATDSFIA